MQQANKSPRAIGVHDQMLLRISKVAEFSLSTLRKQAKFGRKPTALTSSKDSALKAASMKLSAKEDVSWLTTPPKVQATDRSGLALTAPQRWLSRFCSLRSLAAALAQSKPLLPSHPTPLLAAQQGPSEANRAKQTLHSRQQRSGRSNASTFVACAYAVCAASARCVYANHFTFSEGCTC